MCFIILNIIFISIINNSLSNIHSGIPKTPLSNYTLFQWKKRKLYKCEFTTTQLFLKLISSIFSPWSTVNIFIAPYKLEGPLKPLHCLRGPQTPSSLPSVTCLTVYMVRLRTAPTMWLASTHLTAKYTLTRKGQKMDLLKAVVTLSGFWMVSSMVGKMCSYCLWQSNC